MGRPGSGFEKKEGTPNLEALQAMIGLMTPESIKRTVKCHVVTIPTGSHAAGAPVAIPVSAIPQGAEILRIDQLGGASGDSFTVTDNNGHTISVVAGSAANTITMGTLIKTYKYVTSTGLLVTAADTSDTCDLYIYYR